MMLLLINFFERAIASLEYITKGFVVVLFCFNLKKKLDHGLESHSFIHAVG